MFDRSIGEDAVDERDWPRSRGGAASRAVFFVAGLEAPASCCLGVFAIPRARWDSSIRSASCEYWHCDLLFRQAKQRGLALSHFVFLTVQASQLRLGLLRLRTCLPSGLVTLGEPGDLDPLWLDWGLASDDGAIGLVWHRKPVLRGSCPGLGWE